VALALALASAAPSSAAVRSGFDRYGGMRLTLDGRTLAAAKAGEGAKSRAEPRLQPFGKRVLATCGLRFDDRFPGTGTVQRRWHRGVRSLTFTFDRDLSDRVKWCLLTDDATHFVIAYVSFVDREPARLVAKGRGPSGEWWRLWAYRGQDMEPCMSLRTGAGPGDVFSPCFDELSQREATLEAQPQTLADRFVYGPVSRRATAVRVRLLDGSVRLATLYRRPAGSRVLAQYFVLVLPREGPEVLGARAVDAAGRTVGKSRVTNP
jgi:hypothetical protein